LRPVSILVRAHCIDGLSGKLSGISKAAFLCRVEAVAETVRERIELAAMSTQGGSIEALTALLVSVCDPDKRTGLKKLFFFAAEYAKVIVECQYLYSRTWRQTNPID
jgi:hypothetical protein